MQLYRRDALGIQDDELLENLGRRFYARCLDVLMVTDSQVVCVECGTRFEVLWIAQPPERIFSCPTCGWSLSAGDYHASFEHQDLLGGNARAAFERFVEDYPRAQGYGQRMLIVDRLVHALHVSGNTVLRNLVEGRPAQVLAALDALAAGTNPGRAAPPV